MEHNKAIMKSYKLKTFNRKALIISASLILLAFLTAIICLSQTMLDNGIESFLLITIPAIIILYFLLKKYFVKTYVINISNANLVVTLQNKMIYSTLLNEIVMFKYIRKENIDTLIFFATNNQQASFTIECTDQRKKFQRIVDVISNSGNYTSNIQSDEVRTIWTDYINQDIIVKDAATKKRTLQYYQQIPLPQYSN
ncbi:hypothetical protein [Prevotella sp. 10(H)]|uniref:hypothetical protein n=1 Tax=Prevotella sp. 10(H) TaxID=1158294 RepID=UPI0004A6C7BD|nr:hypothetical protein [Prevotella sp. 10(H)]